MLLTKMPVKNPCSQFCQRRNAECHAVCEDYQNWRKEQDKLMEARDMAAKSTPDVPRTLKRKYWRELKRNGFQK